MTVNDSGTLPTVTNALMTLCALASTASVERPSGESLGQHQQRILAGINQQLANAGLAPAGQWQVIWVGLSVDRANLSYIAQGPGNEVAVCLRGTMPGMPIDSAEDLDVGTLIPFVWSNGGNISLGAMEAFTEITSAVYKGYQPQPSLHDTGLVQALSRLVAAASPNSLQIYVTGHSLGGALATTVGLFLANLSWATAPTVQVFTFAAPTAGDATFAMAVSNMSPAPICVYNAYDVVPNAWASLSSVDSFFPADHDSTPTKDGPVATLEVKGIIHAFTKKTKGNVYAQPTPQVALNTDYSVFDPSALGTWVHKLLEWKCESTTAEFEAQAGFQHLNSTYLTLLGAPAVPVVAPAVTSLSPSSGPMAGGTTVTISGSNFTPDCVVDFGTVPATNVAVSSDGSSITATAPALAGTVLVSVTSMYGTATSDSVSFSSPGAS